jgi:hypothetical protein
MRSIWLPIPLLSFILLYRKPQKEKDMKIRFALLTSLVIFSLSCNTLQNLAPQPSPTPAPTSIPPAPIPLPTAAPQPTAASATTAPVVTTPIVKATSSSWDRYEPRKLADIFNKYKKSVDADPVGYYLPYEFPASRVKMTYTGLYRPMSKARLAFVQFGLGSLKIDPEFIKRYEQELLLIEDKVEYWMPVQTPLIPFFEKEVKKGDEAVILNIWVGAIIGEKDKDWIFLITEFNR